MLGMDSGVRSGLMREVKEGEGVERRYSDIRARVSASSQSLSPPSVGPPGEGHEPSSSLSRTS